MFLLFLLSLEIHISPNPIEGKVGEKIPFLVTILNEEGEVQNEKIDCEVVPPTLGKVEKNIFLAKTEGKGILKCKSTVGKKTITTFAYIRIGREKGARIKPPSAVLNPGERIQFRVSDKELLKWKLIPEELGEISNGIFIAKNPGKGRVVAILENGEIKSAFIRVKGRITEVEIAPRFKWMKVGEKTRFSIKGREKVQWEVKPEGIGMIEENGTFYANSPGRAIVLARTKKRVGRAIVVVAGKTKLRIIPEKVILKPGERIHFKIKIGRLGNIRNLPVRWKVIPRRCGIIRRDGTFIAGKIPVRGRVVAVVPERFGGGAVSAGISIVPGERKFLTIMPRLRALDIGEEFDFDIRDENIQVHWKVIPEDLGVITQNGEFTPQRNGSGVIIVEPKDNINISPGRALVIVGKTPNVTLTLPTRNVVEGFGIPIKIETELRDYEVFWRVKPERAGRISSNGRFYTSRLPENMDMQPVTIYAVLHRGRSILGWGRAVVTIVKRK